MAEQLDYGKPGTAGQTFGALALVGVLLAYVFATLDLAPQIAETAQSFIEPTAPLSAVLGWRLIAAGFGIAAVVSMFRVGPGTMEVLMHEKRELALLHPVGFEKFVTFSSWTLLSNILYFVSSSVAAGLHLSGREVPSWLEVTQVCMFVVACGSAFLTATIVRHVILPKLFESNRDTAFIFLYHEQMMHNLAALFLAIEVVIVAPKLHPQLALFCIGMGLVYVCFAYLFAYKGGGFYVYSFIDPRLKYAPFTMMGLAVAIAVFFTGVHLASLIVVANIWAGALVLALWVSLIVQFRPPERETQASS